jgi:hypothetical protein
VNEELAVRIRGWVICEAPEVIVCKLLGPASQQSMLALAPDCWNVEDPILPEEPVGPVRSLVTFESDEPLEVNIVPGSYGRPCPPEEMGHELIRPTVSHKHALVLDGRCWYRVPPAPRLSMSLWVHQPIRRRS